MDKPDRPCYADRNSDLTLQQGLEEYYTANPGITDPKELSPNFAKILHAHDVSHIIFGCDTSMYEELKLLPLIWWMSDYKFSDYLRTIRDPNIRPAINIMYRDLIKQHGLIWLYSAIFIVLPRLLPELTVIWFKNRSRDRYVPFLNFEPLLELSLSDIRGEFDLLKFLK